MTMTLDPFILERAPGPVAELDPALARARSAFSDGLGLLVAIPDERLTSAWNWNGGEADVRYGYYRLLEMLESATSQASRTLAAQPSSEARDAVAAATASRWHLQAILATLNDADLDADPGNDEWSIRRTLQHIVNSQRGYAWGSAYWLSTRNEPRQPGPQRVPDDAFAGFPEEEEEAHGTFDAVRHELDDIFDTTSARYATLSDADMAVMGGWSGVAVSIGFRQWRWSSHIAEHAVQIEKTLDMLGRRRTEVDWLVRLLGRAFGGFDGVLIYRDPSGDAAGVVAEVTRALESLPPQIKAAADAGVPATDW